MSANDEYGPCERADMESWRRFGQITEGRHRAIRQHAFLQYRGDDKYGCGRWEDDDLTVRCGYYRKHHPTMLE